MADRNGRIPLRQFYDCITARCYHIYRPPFENDLGIGQKVFALTMPSCIMGQKPKLLRCHPNWRKKRPLNSARQHAPSPRNGGMPVSYTLRRAGFGLPHKSIRNGSSLPPRTNGRLLGSAVRSLLTLACGFALFCTVYAFYNNLSSIFSSFFITKWTGCRTAARPVCPLLVILRLYFFLCAPLR